MVYRIAGNWRLFYSQKVIRLTGAIPPVQPYIFINLIPFTTIGIFALPIAHVCFRPWVLQGLRTLQQPDFATFKENKGS